MEQAGHQDLVLCLPSQSKGKKNVRKCLSKSLDLTKLLYLVVRVVFFSIQLYMEFLCNFFFFEAIHWNPWVHRIQIIADTIKSDQSWDLNKGDAKIKVRFSHKPKSTLVNYVKRMHLLEKERSHKYEKSKYIEFVHRMD